MGMSIGNRCEMNHIDWAHYRMVGYAWVYDGINLRIFEILEFELLYNIFITVIKCITK